MPKPTKPSAAKPKPSKPAQPSTPESPHRPLAELAKAVGKADAALLDAHLADTSDEELVAVGRTILSARIVTDASRIYGQAWDFWQEASPGQRKALRGFSRELLALGVHQALALEALDAQHAEKTDGAATTRAKIDRTAAATYRTALSLRDQAVSSLRAVAGQHPGRASEVDSTKGDASSGDALAKGLLGLGKLLEGWLKESKTDEVLHRRLLLATLDAAYAKELEDAAAKVRDAAAAAKKRPTGGKVTQGQLDRADGVNLLLLGQVIRAFDAAHDRDPTIPRLVPISTRRLFSRPKKKVVEEADTQETGAEGTEPTAEETPAKAKAKKAAPKANGQPPEPTAPPEEG